MKVSYVHFTDNKLVAYRFKFTKNMFNNLEKPIHQNSLFPRTVDTN